MKTENETTHVTPSDAQVKNRRRRWWPMGSAKWLALFLTTFGRIIEVGQRQHRTVSPLELDCNCSCHCYIEGQSEDLFLRLVLLLEGVLLGVALTSLRFRYQRNSPNVHSDSHARRHGRGVIQAPGGDVDGSLVFRRRRVA